MEKLKETTVETRGHDYQCNDTEHNDTRPNYIHRNSFQHNDTQQNDILQYRLNCDTQNKRDSAQ
jgi:hypothetical protein